MKFSDSRNPILQIICIIEIISFLSQSLSEMHIIWHKPHLSDMSQMKESEKKNYCDFGRGLEAKPEHQDRNESY
jgi:hypothetical protein